MKGLYVYISIYVQIYMYVGFKVGGFYLDLIIN